MCEKLAFNRARLWYEHEPESVVQNKNLKILWDFFKLYDHMIETKRLNIVVVDKVKKNTMIIDAAIPGDIRVCDKEREKIEKYKPVKRRICQIKASEIGRCDSHCSWSIRNYNNKAFKKHIEVL